MIRLPPNAALLLDLDGTLIDIAPTPDSVVVPKDLPATLMALRQRLGDALAIVTGRPIAQVDALLPGVPYAVAGEHGFALRLAPGQAEDHAAVEPIPPEWFDRAKSMAAAHDGAIFEPKARGFVLHFRRSPEAGPDLRHGLTALLANSQHHAIGAAHMAWEVKPVGVDKGGATRAIMQAPPFTGRVPVFVGDDVTDEDGMAAARSLGGLGLRVQDHFGNAAGVREWLRALVSQ